MPRVHFVKKARKDNPSAKKGESYYWVAQKTGPRSSRKLYFKNRPRPSQYQTSDYYGTVYALQEQVEDVSIIEDAIYCEEAASTLESVREEFAQCRDEQEEKYCNMEYAWPNGCPAMELLEQRRESLEELDTAIGEAQDSLENISWPDKPVDYDEEAEEKPPEWVTFEQELEAAKDEAQSAIDGIDWTFE